MTTFKIWVNFNKDIAFVLLLVFENREQEFERLGFSDHFINFFFFLSANSLTYHVFDDVVEIVRQHHFALQRLAFAHLVQVDVGVGMVHGTGDRRRRGLTSSLWPGHFGSLRQLQSTLVVFGKRLQNTSGLKLENRVEADRARRVREALLTSTSVPTAVFA